MRDLGLLGPAVARPRATFDDRELYPDMFTKAAALMDSLINNNHPFVDGNKRTGISAAGLFLRVNGWKLNTPPEDVEACTLRVATEGMQIAELATWFRENAAQD